MKVRLKYMILCLSLFAFGCNDWMDVQPKYQVKEEDLFKSESGFRDALMGIYTLMGRTMTYGGNSTMGFMDILAQTYSSVSSSYAKAQAYDYKEETIKSIIDTIWSSNYNAIANCNYLLANIEKNGGMMNADLRQLVEGEALALRAFLHFDLLRGYAPSCKVGKDSPAIPYLHEVTHSPVEQSTVAKVLDYILEDLKEAQALLKPIDPLGPAFAEYTEKDDYKVDDYITDDGFWLYRKSRFNYYGVTALMARVYLYAEDKVNALTCAKEIIESGKFKLLTDQHLSEDAGTVARSNWSYIQSMSAREYISSLYVYDLKKGHSELFFKDLSTYACEVNTQRKSSIFENVDLDTRSKRLFSIPSGSQKEYVNKYETGNRIPLLKLSEMYLIAAEASGDIGYLEELRAHRGYANQPLPEEADLQEELRKEYQKEFVAEGQLFYFYKRQNLTTIPFTAQAMRDVYVFPMPDNELEFGNIK